MVEVLEVNRVEVKAKKCTKCGDIKSLEEYYFRKDNNKYRNECKECCKSRKRTSQEKRIVTQRKRREKNKDNINKYVRYWSKKRRKEKPDVVRLEDKIDRERYRDKRKAHLKVFTAIKNGIIVKPKKCHKCNSTIAIEGHHEDYLKPLEVVWLCRKCHSKLHRDKRRAKNGR